MLVQVPPELHLGSLLADPIGQERPSRPQTGRSQRLKDAFLAAALDVVCSPHAAASHSAAAGAGDSDATVVIVATKDFLLQLDSRPQTPCFASADEAEEQSPAHTPGHTFLSSPCPAPPQPSPSTPGPIAPQSQPPPSHGLQEGRARWRGRGRPPGALVLVKRRWLRELLDQLPFPQLQLEAALAGATGAEAGGDGEVTVQQQQLDQALGALPKRTSSRYRLMREVLDTTAGFACVMEAAMDVDGAYTAHQVGSMMQRFHAQQEGSSRKQPPLSHACQEAAGRRRLIHVLGFWDLNAAAAVIQRAYRRFKVQRKLWKVVTMKRGHVVERDWKLGSARSCPLRLKQEGQYAISPAEKTEAGKELMDDYVQSAFGRQESRFKLTPAHGTPLNSAEAAAKLACHLGQSSEPNLSAFYKPPAATAADAIVSNPRPQLDHQLHTQLHSKLHILAPPSFQAKHPSSRYLIVQSSLRHSNRQGRGPGAKSAGQSAPTIRKASSSLASNSSRPTPPVAEASQTRNPPLLPGSSPCPPGYARRGSVDSRPNQEGPSRACGPGTKGCRDQGGLRPRPSASIRSVGGGGGRGAQPWVLDSVPLAALERSAGPSAQLQYLWRQASLSVALAPVMTQPTTLLPGSTPGLHRQASFPKMPHPQGREPLAASRRRRLTASDSGGAGGASSRR